MKISEILKQDKLQLSFEVFPPKTATSFENVLSAAKKIAAMHPAFISVTYGAGGNGGNLTVEIAKEIKDKMKVPVLAHLTCVNSKKDMIQKRTRQLKEAKIENILALRGDLSPDSPFSGETSEFPHALDLVRELKNENNDFCLGGACYPECHPESRNQEQDIDFIKKKVDAGCEFLTTQMFFDNNLFYNFMYKIRQAGITVPILPGIMPITAASQVQRSITLSGSFMPQRFKSLVDKFGDNSEAMKQAGIAYATDQIIDLFANGIKLVHVYSMNKPDVAGKIMDNLSNILG